MDGNSQWSGKYGQEEMQRRASYGNGSFTGTNSQWGGDAPSPTGPASPSGGTFSPRATGRQLNPPSPINVAGAR